MNSLCLDKVNECSPYRVLYREGHEGDETVSLLFDPPTDTNV